MLKKDKVKYWLKAAEHDLEVAHHLFAAGDYSYALFFGHLTLEKVLKALYADKHGDTPPFSHNLVYLAEKIGLEIDNCKLELLEEVSDYNLEARYPDDKFNFFKRCTQSFSASKLKQIEEIKVWLLQKIQ